MRTIVVLGRGGAGKSTLAALGATLALPVIELDKHFWAPT
jgi:adenylate kinase family enzyme